MLLKIQPDESLTSYVRRNHFLSWNAPDVAVFKELAKRPAFWKAEVQAIASAFGWPGCYGFNRLIHHHTMLAATYVIKNAQDFSYSENLYASEDFCFSNWDASYCPDCVREDLESLGFSYWRRFCSPHVKVCHKHNTVLLDHCPFCGKSFSRFGHTLDVMWRKCEGRHLGDASSIPNGDPAALRRAIVFYGICSSPHHIPDEGALRLLQDKAASLIPMLSGDLALEMRSEFQHLGSKLEFLRKRRLTNNANRFGGVGHEIIDSITKVYEHFDDFLMDLRSQEFDVRPIDTLWATYQAAGMESAHFVEEDYIGGTGRWFCPYPSPVSEHDRSYDGYARRTPKQYPCCNFPHPKGKGKKLKAIMVRALPCIPKTSPENARAKGIVA